MSIQEAKRILNIRTDDVERLRAFGRFKLQTLVASAPLRYKVAASTLANV